MKALRPVYAGAYDGACLPPDIGPGAAIIQINAAWIPGAQVSIQLK
jgi:hypothetical protein